MSLFITIRKLRGWVHNFESPCTQTDPMPEECKTGSQEYIIFVRRKRKYVSGSLREHKNTLYPNTCVEYSMKYEGFEGDEGRGESD